MIEFKNIKKTYNGQVVVDIDRICLEKGAKYVLTGSNGSGKSTFARIIASVIKDDTNEIKRIVRSKDKEGTIKYLQVGYLPQKPYMFDMKLESNIRIGYNKENDDSFLDTKNSKETREEHITKRVDALISDLKLDYLRKKNAKGFSGGEQQKVAMARFFMQDFDVVILDEPTSAMDSNSELLAEKVIKKYTEGKTLILISHESDQVKRFNGKMLVMNNGKII